ncbi:MAG: hypothetical protein ACEY3L_16145, partial [Wolbachia sp.]
LSAICSTNSLILVWLNLKSLHKFVVNHHCLRCYATKPSQCLGTGMTGEGTSLTTVIPLCVSGI